MTTYLFNEFQRSKWQGFWNLPVIGITYVNFVNSANIERPSYHDWKIAISFNNLNFSHFERVTTPYKPLQTWIGPNVTHYHSMKALPRALPYRFSEICLVLCCFQRANTVILFKKNINIHFFINLIVTRGNAWQIAPKPW